MLSEKTKIGWKVEGKKNPADISSKEEKSPQQYTTIRDTIIQDPFIATEAKIAKFN